MRKQLTSPGVTALPPNSLKYSDDQTCAGLAAVVQAIRGHGLAPESVPSPFRDWAIVGAPRFLGRATMSTDLPRFLAEGAWGVSPHMIPHRSMHALSGTLSQALAAHGPNFGVGGGPGAEVEGLLCAVALLAGMNVPGVWLVLTRLDPEESADPNTGRPFPGTRSLAVALALMPAGAAGAVRLELTAGRSMPSATSFTLGDLADMLDRLSQQTSVSHALGDGGQLTVRRGGPPLAGPHFARLASERSLTTP
jgi:hypothetical protein